MTHVSTTGLERLSRFINGTPCRHLPMGKTLSLVSIAQANPSLADTLVIPAGGFTSPTHILTAICLSPPKLAISRLAWSAAMHLALAIPDGQPWSAISQSLGLLDTAGFSDAIPSLACGASILDCKTQQVFFSHTPQCSLTCMRDGQPVPQTALDSHQSHNQAETVLSAGSYTLKEGDRLYWKVCENIEPKLTDKSSHPVLEQIVEACTPEIRLKLTPQDESEVAEAIDRVSETLIATLDQAGFESAESRIRLIVEESILNAWRHGNKKNPKKSIHLRWRLGVDCILEVEDEGSGFDYQSLVDPRRAENIYKLSGRGIFIVNNYAGKIEWALGGRLVRIMIQRAIPDEQTLQNCTNLVEYCKAMSQK